MSGAFAIWQPRYAAHSVATFPVKPDKTPAVKGYLRIGTRVSEQLALKFPANDAFGFACKRNRITVLDVDAPNERMLAEALDRHGPTPLVVRSGSGNFQAWYRHNGETRRVRPDPSKPIDILGDGYVVAPPSIASKGRYEIIEGSLDDLDRLPTMRGPCSPDAHNITKHPPPSLPPSLERVNSSETQAARNDTLWRWCMSVAPECAGITDLLEKAMSHNATAFYQPLPAEEVLKIIASAWEYEINGNNWFGRRGRATTDRDEILAFARDPWAALLLSLLRVSHPEPDTRFAIDQVQVSELLGWNRRTLIARIKHLIASGHIRRVHHGKGKGDPHLYVLISKGRSA